MTNTELVRQLRTASVQCDEMRLRDFGYLFKTAADKVDELLGSVEMLDNLTDMLSECVPQWIPVTERLPEENKVVLVWGGASIYTAKYHHKYGGVPMWWKLNSKQHYCNPTHWMPLPNPPEKGREE